MDNTTEDTFVEIKNISHDQDGKVDIDSLIEKYFSQSPDLGVLSNGAQYEPSSANEGQKKENDEKCMYSPISYSCYYCDDYTSNDEREYTVHVINTHGRLAFPSKADIEKLGLKPQGKPWEV